MERFGQPGFREELDGSKIHRLANILTLEQFLHTQFDKLALWLEADAVSPNERCKYFDDTKLCSHNIPTASAQSMTISNEASPPPSLSRLAATNLTSQILDILGCMRRALALHICLEQESILLISWMIWMRGGRGYCRRMGQATEFWISPCFYPGICDNHLGLDYHLMRCVVLE
jgi:hypothetical protein